MRSGKEQYPVITNIPTLAPIGVGRHPWQGLGRIQIWILDLKSSRKQILNGQVIDRLPSSVEADLHHNQLVLLERIDVERTAFVIQPVPCHANPFTLGSELLVIFGKVDRHPFRFNGVVEVARTLVGEDHGPAVLTLDQPLAINAMIEGL